MQFLHFHDLHSQKGIDSSKATLWRQERTGLFPRRTPLSPQRYGWPEEIIDVWVEALAAGHSRTEATKLAEQHRARLTAQFHQRIEVGA